MKFKVAAYLVAVLLFMANYACRHQQKVSIIVQVTEANGALTVAPAFIKLPANGTPATIVWQGSPGLTFRVEPLYSKLCDREESNPDKNEVVCDVPSSHEGAFAFKVVATNAGGLSTGVLARIGSCGACDSAGGGVAIGIACDRGIVQSTAPNENVGQGSVIEWIALGNPVPDWKITFTGTSPCAQPSISNGGPSCRVTGGPAEYTYTMTVAACRAGQAKLIVK